jgi:hypothetical protein
MEQRVLGVIESEVAIFRPGEIVTAQVHGLV